MSAAAVGAAPYVPETASLSALARAAQACEGCELYRNATQAVFGRGPVHAPVMLVGEQPGDVEDERGEPFVGPAGRLLDQALADAGLQREEAYVTNAVKHFRWKPATSGKRRIHDSPSARHVTACVPWLQAELGVVRPRVLVALGAVAARAVFGTGFRLTQHRGQVLDWPYDASPIADAAGSVESVLATLHPSACCACAGRTAARRTTVWSVTCTWPSSRCAEPAALSAAVLRVVPLRRLAALSSGVGHDRGDRRDERGDGGHRDRRRRRVEPHHEAGQDVEGQAHAHQHEI
jgi:DNA polymerase